MSLFGKLFLPAVLVALLPLRVRAYHKEADTCAFEQVGKPTCLGKGTTEVADFARLYVGTAESYAVGWHPCGVIALLKVNLVGGDGLAHKMRFNGLYAYVNKVEGEFYYFPTVGCEKPYVLREKDEYLPGLTDLTSRELLKIVIHLVDGYPYDTACSHIQYKTLVGPSPNVPIDVPLANAYMDLSILQSAHIVPYNSTSGDLAKYLSRVSKSGTCVKSDCKSVILSETIPPVVRKCKRKVFDLVEPEKGKYPEISALKPNSACFWSSVVAEKLTKLIVYRLLYVYWGIRKSDGTGVYYFEGYVPTFGFDYTFDPLYYSYC